MVLVCITKKALQSCSTCEADDANKSISGCIIVYICIGCVVALMFARQAGL